MIQKNMKRTMNGKSDFSLTFMLITMLFLNMLAISPASAIDTPEIYLVSSTISSNLEWNLTALVKDIPSINAIFAYQITLIFNTSVLECMGAWIPESDEAWIFSGLTTVSPAPTINNVRGFVLVGDSILIGTSVSGSGPFSLAVFEFHINGQLDDDPMSYIKIGSPDTYLLNDALKEISPIVKTNSVNSAWSSTAKPYMETDPAHLEFDTSSGVMRKLLNFADGRSTELVVGLSENFPNGLDELAFIAAKYGGEISKTVSMDGKIVAAVVNMTSTQVYLFKSVVEASGLSRYIEPNYVFRALTVPNDPLWPDQWGPRKIEADWAWNTTLGNASILVAVVDSGIDYNHPDLQANYVALGYDFVNNDPYPMDDFGHGTHVAGIIAATINNDIGIAGLSQVQIMAEKVLNDKGRESRLHVLADGITHAIEQGADIISMSWGGYSNSSLIYDAIKTAYNAGVLLVAAAGNEGGKATVYPAAYDEVIAVAATNENDGLYESNNYGNWIGLSAPGVNITSTTSRIHRAPFLGYPYYSVSGTSMAAPHVTGTAALIWSRFPDMTRDDVRYQLSFTANDLGDDGFDERYGSGRINARKAVEEAKPEHDLGIIYWEFPRYLLPDETLHVKTKVVNFGKHDEYNVTVQLRANTTLVNSSQVSLMSSGAVVTFDVSWTPPGIATYLISSHVVQVLGENRTSNNNATGWLMVRDPGVLYVPQDYMTIQSAIEDALPFDTIRVSNGTYYEHLEVKKPMLSIIGQSKDATIIDGENIGTVVRVLEDQVTISGFTIQNSGPDAFDNVLLLSSNGNNITDNIVTNGYEGIHLIAAHNNTVEGNTVTQIEDTAILLYPAEANGNNISRNTIGANSGLGIYLQNSNDNRIYENNVTSSTHYGIYILWGEDNEVFDNEVTSTLMEGIASVLSERVRIEGNSLRGNTIGLYLNSVSSDSLVTGNKFVNNTYGIELWLQAGITVEANYFRNNSIGVLIREATNNKIKANYFRNNSISISIIRGATFNTIKANHIRNNGVGIRIYATAPNNTIYWNNFLNNTEQVNVTSPNIWHGRWNVTGNYWSDYTGNNTDGDPYGIGDTPYNVSANNQDNFPFMNPYLPGDITHDGKVDLRDIARVARAWGSHGPPDESDNWNPHADLNEDGFVDDLDIDIVAPNYGLTWQDYWGE